MTLLLILAVALFAVFPLTDTDIWWHLACAREWVTTWTPVRSPIVNVHEYFQHTVYFIYNIGGAPLLVAFKAFLWALVFALFLIPFKKKLGTNIWNGKSALFAACLILPLLFVFRFQFEIRPVVFTLVFLGVFWNTLPWLFQGEKFSIKLALASVFVLCLQWLWCRFQGLFVLGPILAGLCFATALWNQKFKCSLFAKVYGFSLVAFLMAMPFLHADGLNLFLYPFGLLDRLLGMSPSAMIFAKEIAENRSPFTLLFEGENMVQSGLMILSVLVSFAYALFRFRAGKIKFEHVWLVVAAVLSLIAERNFSLFLPVFVAFLFLELCKVHVTHKKNLIVTVLAAFVLGLFLKSVLAYDHAMVSYQRVPVRAAEWSKTHPHEGRLFNDDRAGGYLAFVNPTDSVFIDGRFILKTSEFFSRYLLYAEEPDVFLKDANLMNIDRAILPIRYYARWKKLIVKLCNQSNWKIAYQDEYFVVLARSL